MSDPSMNAGPSRQEVVVHLDGMVVGPDQWLVLTSRRPITHEEAARIKDQMPNALHGRVLVVDSMTGYVVDQPRSVGVADPLPCPEPECPYKWLRVVSVYKTDDLVWCYRCKRMESVGAVFHDGPYTTENSRLVERAEDRVYDRPAPVEKDCPVSISGVCLQMSEGFSPCMDECERKGSGMSGGEHV